LPPAWFGVRIKLTDGADAFEETVAFAEEDGDEVELDLVEDASGEGGRRAAHAVDEDVAIASGLLGAGHRLGDVIEDGD
jgi:hypothetical protein